MKKALLFCVMLCMSCAPRIDPDHDYKNEMIKGPGTYRVHSGEYSIVVEVYDHSLVRYTVTKKDQIIIKSIERASIASRWYLFWDDNNLLWVKSSDIGNFVWVPDETLVHHEYALHEHPELLKKLPAKIQPDFVK